MTQREDVLVRRCRDGDEAAWAALYRDYAPVVGRFVSAMLGRPSDLEDLVQRVFLELLRSLPRFRGEARLTTWLHRIAHRVVLHELRSVQRQRRRRLAYAQESAVSPIEAGGPFRQADARARLRVVGLTLADMDSDLATVWVMRELQGLEVDEVSVALGARAGTVRTRHHRARKRILAALEQVASVEEREGHRPGGRSVHRPGGTS